MCCVIVVWLCLSIFESLRVREIRKAWTNLGDVEVSVGVRSIWRAWTPGSTEESTCVVRFLDPLFLVTWGVLSSPIRGTNMIFLYFAQLSKKYDKLSYVGNELSMHRTLQSHPKLNFGLLFLYRR